ncbi:MAG: MerR family transcriptional regulator [Gammaproteobacteria bacterium]
MNSKQSRSDDGDAPVRSELYPIGTIASLTGVKPITLRAWERRYGMIEPVRTSSGRRMYTREDIDLINRVVAMLDRGMRIGQVKAELEAQDRREQGINGDSGDPSTALRRRMTTAIIRFDEDALDDAYNEALSLYSVDIVTRDVLTPMLVALGERWRAGIGSIAEEHFFGFYLRNKLGARFHHRSRGDHGSRLLAACLPNEQHENGLLLLALALHERGYRMVLLGANMPLEEIPAATLQARCDGVVLSGSLDPSAELLAVQLPRVVAESTVPIIVGGSASVRCHDMIQAAGAEPVGDDLEKGIQRIEALLERRPADSGSGTEASNI